MAQLKDTKIDGQLIVKGNISTEYGIIPNKQDILPINSSGSSNRVWVATCNKLKDAEGNKRTAVLIGDVQVSGANKTDAQIIDGSATVVSGFHVLNRVGELKTMEDGQFDQYIETTTKNSSGKTFISYYWTYPYYLKRVSAELTGSSPEIATSSGPKVGIATLDNFFSKWNKGDINPGMPYSNRYIDAVTGEDLQNAVAYQRFLVLRYRLDSGATLSEDDTNQYNRYAEYFVKAKGFVFDIGVAADNDEPFSQTIATRGPLGQLVVEDATEAFHAINKRQLDPVIEVNENQDKRLSSVESKYITSKFKRYSKNSSLNVFFSLKNSISSFVK